MRRQLLKLARIPVFLALLAGALGAGWQLGGDIGPVGQATATERPAAAPPPAAPARETVAAAPVAEPRLPPIPDLPQHAASAGPHRTDARAIAWLIEEEGARGLPPAPAPAAREAQSAALGPEEPLAEQPPVLLHLASYRHAAAARQGWRTLVAQAPLLRHAARALREAELPDGRYVRLFAVLPPGTDAEAACSDLSRQGLYCRVLREPGAPLS